MNNKDTALANSIKLKKMLPFRIHYIYVQKQTPDFWETGCSFTLARVNNLVRKGAHVEILQ